MDSIPQHSSLWKYFPGLQTMIVQNKRPNLNELEEYTEAFFRRNTNLRFMTAYNLGGYILDKELTPLYGNMNEGKKFAYKTYYYMNELHVIYLGGKCEEKELLWIICYILCYNLQCNNIFIYFLSQEQIFNIIPILGDELTFYIKQEFEWQNKYSSVERKNITSNPPNLGISFANKSVEQTKVLNIYPPNPHPYQIFFEHFPPETNGMINYRDPERIWVHAPFQINMSRRGRHPLEQYFAAVSYGMKGVVFHTGSRTDMSEEQAVNNMTLNITSIMRHLQKADKDSQVTTLLLIETCAGEGSKLFPSPYDLAQYINNLRETVDKRINICLDTCHVFAAGYDPEDVFEYLYRYDLVRLIHFNDSSYPRGLCRDSHAAPGTGYIGYSVMKRILDKATQRRIPCIIE